MQQNLPSRKVLLVDDDSSVLNALGDFFEFAAQMASIRARSYKEVLAHQAVLLSGNVTLAILDINLGANEPSGIDVYNWLQQNGFRGQIVFLTGHAKHHPLVNQAQKIQGVTVFEKPLDLNRLLSLVGAS